MEFLLSGTYPILEGNTELITTMDYVQWALVAVVFIAIPILLWFYSKRFLSVILSVIFSVLGITFAVLDFHYMFVVVILLYAVFLLINFFVNLSFWRPHLITRFRGKRTAKTKLKKDKEVSKIFDREELYASLKLAVENFSRTQTGALITFERDDDLKPLMRNGVILNSPFNRELLETIFYKGTRLHDGAVIIKGNKIVAASVYYNLTTRPLNGKYGTRHRAAIGISENSDSVTVVVSEETGRVSIAKDGKLEPVSLENFERIFSEYMEED